MTPRLLARALCACLGTTAICAVAAGGASSMPAGVPATTASAQGDTSGVSVDYQGVSLRYGQFLTALGAISGGAASVPVVLEYRPAGASWSAAAAWGSATPWNGGGSWEGVASASTDANGAFVLRAPLPMSGQVRVVAAGDAGSSDPMPVTVQAGLRSAGTSLTLVRGHATRLAGAVLPPRAGRLVFLELLVRHRWRAVAGARTRGDGSFRLTYRPEDTGSHLARIRFAGDARNASSAHRLGTLIAFRPSFASWYGGGGPLSCGGSLGPATMGVANLTLPCGTLVTLRYGRRTVRVPVIDRGPFVPGREFDLTQATKAALGFPDLGRIWVSI